MALLWKLVDENDSRQLTVTGKFSSEPFPNAEASGVSVVDGCNSPWTFKYRVKGNKRILSGPHWVQFFGCNNVQVGDQVVIHHNDGWGPQADYKIQVIRRPSY